MSGNDTDVLKSPLWLLKITGQDPRMNKKRFLVGSGLFAVTYLIFIVAVLANFLYLDGNLILFVGNCEGFAVLTQTFGKVLVIMYYKNTFVKLIEESNKFTTDDCEDPIIKQKLDIMLTRISSMQKIFIRMMIMTIILMEVSPYITKQFPTGVWNIPNQNKLYVFVLIVQEIACPFYVFYTISIDCLFLGFCMQLIVQLKILQNSLKELSVSEDTTKYFSTQKWCIRRHNYLLWYSQLLADTYSPILFLQYISISIVAFVEMYLVFKSNNRLNFARGGLFLVAGLLQLSFYCVPAEYVSNENLAVATAVSESGWYVEYIPASRSNLLFIITRAQQRLKFSASGLVDIEVKTLVSVINFAWSVCTLMRGLQNASTK